MKSGMKYCAFMLSAITSLTVAGCGGSGGGSTTTTPIGGSNIANQEETYGVQGTPASSNIPGARKSAMAWTDASGNFWLFSGNGTDSAGNSGYLNNLWE
jgi:hypothetical protein